MSELILPRRNLLLGGAASLLAAPAVIRVAKLMPIKGYKVEVLLDAETGSGAIATAILQNGVIVGINILSGGFGYTEAPSITFR